MAGGGKIWRIEAADGRGPFRPGFSHRWRSPVGKDFPPPWVEAGISLDDFQDLFSEGFQGGCACRTKRQLHQWFNLSERLRLRKFGFRTVRFTPDRILLETPTQVIFERRIPAHNPIAAGRLAAGSDLYRADGGKVAGEAADRQVTHITDHGSHSMNGGGL